MPASQHDPHQHQLAAGMPAAREAIGGGWRAGADADAAIAADDLEGDVEDGEGDGVGVEVGALDAGDDEDGEDQEPEVVRELARDLLPDELRAGGVDAERQVGGGVELGAELGDERRFFHG